MTEEEFGSLLAVGHELTSIEFKGPGAASDRHLFALVTKAALGMTNRRDGGRVILGVSDTSGVLYPTGLTVAERDSWNYDDISAKFAEYADPSLSFEITPQPYDGKHFVIIRVREFEDIPVLCKKQYQDVLRQGACFVRPRRKPETTEIPTQEDMRDLLDLAAEKRLRKHLELTSRAGGTVVSSALGTPVPTDQQLFQEQLSDL